MANQYTKEQKELSKNSIREALFILMETKDFQSISISDISKKSGVSRMAFYRNYDIKEDVLIDYFDEKIGNIYNELNILEIKNPYDINLRLLDYIDSHSELFERTIKSKAESILFERFSYYIGLFYSNNIKSIPFEGIYEKYWNRFTSAGMYYSILEWIRTGKKDSKEELATILTDLCG